MVDMLPKPLRKAEIIESLDYAETIRNEINRAIAGAYRTDGDTPKFIAQRAGDVLSHSRECFDHLGKDLIEAYLLPVSGLKFESQYKAEDVKAYFPFYAPMIEQPNRVFHRFKKANRAVYDKLEWFVGGMDRNGRLFNTWFEMRQFRMVADMVNEKKHGRVMYGRAIELSVEADEKVFVQSGEDSFIFDKGFRNDHPNVRIALPPDPSFRSVPAYRFKGSGIDVAKFCLFAVHATQMVMDSFYDDFFAPTERKVYQPDRPVITVTNKPPPNI